MIVFRSRRSGFTLIEMVISASVMSVILVAAYLCLRSGLISQKLVDSRADVVQGGRVAMAMIAADLRAACPLSKQFPFIGMQRTIEGAEADNLDFATHNFIPQHPREADWCEISYFVGQSDGGRGLSLWRRRDPTPDDDPFAGGTREEIVRGLRSLTLEYYDGLDWYDTWGDPDGRGKAQNSLRDHPNLYGMPEAVRITLSIAPELRVTSTNDTPSEPPLILQTICRLNLAGVSASDGLTGASRDSGNQQPNSAQEGGNQ